MKYSAKFEICDIKFNEIRLRSLLDKEFNVQLPLKDLDFYIITEGIPLNPLTPQDKVESREGVKE